jgi:hypothetical protein
MKPKHRTKAAWRHANKTNAVLAAYNLINDAYAFSNIKMNM